MKAVRYQQIKASFLITTKTETQKPRTEEKYRRYNAGSDTISWILGITRDLKQSGRQRQGRPRLKNKFLPLIAVSCGAIPQLQDNV